MRKLSDALPRAARIWKEGVKTYRRLFPYLKPYRSRFVFGAIFGVLYGLTQGLMVLVVKDVGSVVFPSVDGQVTPTSNLWAVIGLCAAVPAIMSLRGLFSYLNSYLMIWVSMHVLNDIRVDVFNKIISHSMSFFTTRKSGELIQIVFGRTRAAQNALTQVSMDVIKQPVSIMTALGALFYIDWKFTLGAFILFPISLIPVMLVSKKVREAGNEEEEQASGLIVVMHEAFGGIRLVKSSSMEGYESRRFSSRSLQSVENAMQWKAAIEKVGPMVEAIASMGISAALFYAWYFNIGAAHFMALNGGLILLYPPFKQLSRLHLMMQKCASSTGRIFEILDLEPEIQDKPGAVVLEKCAGHIEFDHVSFGYRSGLKKKKKSALHDFTLNIEPGTTCALVGSSGAGKTTVMSLLLRLWDSDEGSIRLEGHDLRDLTQDSLRQHVAIVTQDTFLFHDTLANNIRYGRRDATREEIEQAAKLANAHDFIMKMEDGYETIAGDKGCMLSGGQQQRISIARALLKNAPILLLDEATSALDSESEKAIQDALATLTAGRTVIVIAHRLSTVLNADKIVVMAKGRIKETGTHSELYEKSGIYRKLYDIQFHSHDQDNLAPAAPPVPEAFDVIELNQP